MSTSPCILIAGGGTGGHVFPGLALAEALESGARVDIVFCGTSRGMESRVIPARGYRLELLEILPIKGGGPVRAVQGIVVAARAVVEALAMVRRLMPKVVVSVGGYAAGPTALAAALIGVPVAVVEPNGTVGLANRILGPLAQRAYVAWGPAAKSFAPKKTRRFGVPLRRGFTPSTYETTSRARVLVLGGSQGAAPLNERLPEALSLVARDVPNLEVVHQSGAGREETVLSAYRRFGMKSVRVDPFFHDIAGELSRADLVVARAGAGTVAEIAAKARPALLIPFPEAADDHQTKNAQALVEAGGAICLPQSVALVPRLARDLSALLNDPARLTRMSRASRAFGQPNAARDIARDLASLGGIDWTDEASRPDKANGALHTEVP